MIWKEQSRIVREKPVTDVSEMVFLVAQGLCKACTGSKSPHGPKGESSNI